MLRIVIPSIIVCLTVGLGTAAAADVPDTAGIERTPIAASSTRTRSITPELSSFSDVLAKAVELSKILAYVQTNGGEDNMIFVPAEIELAYTPVLNKGSAQRLDGITPLKYRVTIHAEKKSGRKWWVMSGGGKGKDMHLTFDGKGNLLTIE